MLLNAKAAFVSSPDASTPSPSQITPRTFCDHVGFLCVPETEDAAVLLLLDLSGAPPPTDVDAVCPWYHLRQAGYPCLLAVLAAPLKTPPPPPLSTPSVHSPVDGLTHAIRKTKDEEEEEEEPTPANETQRTTTARSSHPSSAAATVLFSAEEPLYVCVHSGDAASQDKASHPANGEVSGDVRWYQLWLPRPSLYSELRALLSTAMHNVSDTNHQRGAALSSPSSPSQLSCASSSPRQFHVVCRDVWPLPPAMPPSPRPLRHAASTPACERRSFKASSAQQQQQQQQQVSSLVLPRRPASALQMNSVQEGSNESSRETSLSINAAPAVVVGGDEGEEEGTDVPLWSALADHLRHLARWNTGILTYLFQSSYYLGDALLLLSTTTSDGSDSASRNHLVKNATVHELLRVLFRFWHQTLRAPRVSGSAVPPRQRSSLDDGNDTEGQAVVRGDGHTTASTWKAAGASTDPQEEKNTNEDGEEKEQQPSAAAKVAASAAEQTSPLLGTPTQISRAFFQETLRKQLQEAQQEQQQQQQARDRDGVSARATKASDGTAVHERATQLPRVIETTVEAAARQGSGLLLPSPASSQEPSGSIATDTAAIASLSHHLTSVAFVEQLLWCIDFSLAYARADGRGRAASRSVGLPTLSASVSLEDVWNSFLLQRIQRAMTRGDLDGSATDTPAAASHTAGASGEKTRVRDAGDVDLGCSAMDVWRLWTHSSAEVSASDRPFQSTDALRDGSGGGASQLTSPSLSVPSVMPQETATIRDSPADANTQEHQTHSAVADPVPAAPLTLHQPSPQPTAGAELPSVSLPAPPPQPRRAASHVSFSVSDVQQPYKVHATPDAIAAEAAVRAAARHTRERAATPPTPPSLLAESQSKLFVLEAEDGGRKNMKKRGMKGERATRGDHVAAGESASGREEAISRVSGAATAVRSAGKENASSLLWVLPHRYITSVVMEDDEGAKESDTKKRKWNVHGRASSPLLEKPVQHKTHLLPRPASVPCPCPSDTAGQHSNCAATTNKEEQQQQRPSHLLSELPSVSSTALPLRGVSVTTATTAAEQCRPPSRIESWDSSTSSAEQDSNANNENGNGCDGGVEEGDKHTHSNTNDGGSAPAEKSGAAVQPAARTAQPSVPYPAHQQERSPTLTRSSTNMNTAAASSSSSLIASEHRLFPVIDDDGDDDDGGGAGHDALTADTAAFKGDNAKRTVAPPSQFPHSPSRTRDGGCGGKRKDEGEETTAAGQSVVPGKDRVPPRDALHSAASFTTVLAALVEHALAYPTTPSSSSSASPSTVKPFAEGTPSMSAVDAAAAQRGLSAVQRGQLFPSLATMDALNLLPYYVHVWCYTYDPFTQQGRRQRGGGGGGGIPSGGGRSSGGGGGGGKRYAALTSGYYANASPYECVYHHAHTYLQRYEPGAAYNSRGSGADISSGGGGGGSSSSIHNSSSSSGHGATTQQLLRGLMLHGARTLWRGVKTTAHRSVRDAMGIYSQGKNADGSGGVGGGAHAAHHDAHAFTLPGAQGHGAVYSSGPAPASIGGRDVIKDPSLYYAVCGLYITEQDIIIRSMPTSEVRKRREKARERRRLHRRAQLQQQQKQQQQQQQQNMLRRHSVADFSSTARSAAHDTQSEAEVLEEDSDTEEAELLLLPRVGLLAVTACPVNRNAGGVFGDKYAHKLFLHQEEQVVALRAHQQQQQHRRRQQLRHQAASAVGLADLPAATSPITAPHRHSPDATLHRDTVSNRSSGGVDSGGSGRTLAEGGSGAGVRTHTTLMPYVEEMISCTHTTQNTATAAAAAAAPPQSSASTTRGYAATSKALSLGSTLKAAVTGGTAAGRRDGRRAGVQRYFTSLFRQTADDNTLRSDDFVEDAETAATSVAPSAQRADSRATATAASPASSPAAESAVGGGVFVSIFTQSPGPHDTALQSHLDESATAAALAAAASVLTSSSQLVSSQPTLVLKIESKAMPTVWLEFADVTTLTYVHRLLETPLRSAAASNALTRAETATQPKSAACKTASAASGVTSTPVEERLDTQHSDDHHRQQQQQREESRLPSFALTSRLSPLGNRFLSSARRHPSMTALVLIAAGVLPRGAAASPFMQAFLRNVSVATTMLRCASTAGVAVRCPRPFNAAENREDRAEGEGDRVREAGSSAPRSLHHTKDKTTSSSTVATGTAAATACVSLADTWWLYHPAREFRRLGLSADRWAITTANSDFSFCPTYPSHFIVPATVAEAMEAGEISGQHRFSNRMESLVFYYAPTGGVLVRSAQPAIARLFMNSAAPSLEVGALMPATRRSGEASGDGEAAKKDCRQLAANTSRMGGDTAAAAPHATTTTSSASAIPLMDVPFLVLNALAAAAGVSPHQLVVMDLRTVTAAYANMMRGGGTVDMLLYPFGAVEYAGLANIHEIRRAWLRLRAAVLDVPYTLTCDGGAAGRRETVYVLRAGEPPYAAVVAAAERWVGGSSTRPPPTAASVCLPSSQVKRSGGRNAAAPSCAAASTTEDQKQQQQQQLYDSGAFAGGSSLTQIDSESDESSHRDRCLDVVQQAATAARSNTATTPPTAASAAAASRDGAAHRSTADAENESVDAACSEGEEDSASAFPPPLTNSSRPFFFSFSRSTDKTAGGSSAISTAASMLSTTSAAAAAAAAETTNAAQQEWLGHLCGLLNTAIVAARRVSGVPTDPLYVPAMAHNGTTPNCFSYVVGHAFTRFWLPSRASEAWHGRHTRTATTTPSANHTAAAAAGLHSGSHTSSSWWRSVPEARAWPHKSPSPSSSFSFPSESQAFGVAPASFEHSADRSLAQVVLVNCSDGWDRTAQISILTQLLLDPYYRTVEGLCVLLERELVCFGHPLQRRSTAVQGNANGGWEASDPKASEKPQEEGGVMTATPVRVPTDGAEPLTTPPPAPESSAHDAQQQEQQESVDAQRDHDSHGDVDGPVHRAASPLTPKMSHKQRRQEEKEEEKREQAREDAAGKDAAADGNADCSDSSEEDEDNLDSWLRRNGGWSALDCTDADNTNTVQTADDGAALVPQQQRQGLQKQSWEAFWRQGANALSSGALGLWNAESLKPSSTFADSHRYSKRSGAPAAPTAAAAATSTSLRDASPIVAQLLDALYQLVRLYPACFEFTENFVVLLLDLLHCGLVSTFAVNSEKQVRDENVTQGTLSLSQWCALLLSTTTTAGSAPHVYDEPRQDDDMIASPSAHPHELQRQAQQPLTPSPTSSISGYGGRGGGGGDSGSLTATASSVGGSFQRLDSRFLLGDGASRDDNHDADDGEDDDDDDEGTEEEVVSSGSVRPPPPPSQQQSASTPPSLLPGGKCDRVERLHRNDRRTSSSSTSAAAMARGLSHFDCSTAWQPGGHDTTRRATRGGSSSSNSNSSSTTDAFTQRLLPISADALYTSGYLNPEFSLRYNKHSVGPLVDFVLPSQLTLWRSAYSRYSFWGTRQHQLQRGVGQARLEGATLHSPYVDKSDVMDGHGGSGGVGGGVASRLSSSWSSSPELGRAVDGAGQRRSDSTHTAAFSSSVPYDGREKISRSSSCLYYTHSPSHGDLSQRLADSGGGATRRGDGTVQTRSGATTGGNDVPFLGATPPGMMNFHLGSDSDEEENEVGDTEQQRW